MPRHEHGGQFYLSMLQLLQERVRIFPVQENRTVGFVLLEEKGSFTPFFLDREEFFLELKFKLSTAHYFLDGRGMTAIE